MKRKTFIKTAGTVLAGSLIASHLHANPFGSSGKKIRVAMVGTGNRGMDMWCKPVIEEFGDVLEFVGLCDINE